MSTHGLRTSEAARYIAAKLNPLGYDVYYDHGKKGEFVGKIAVSIEEKLSRENELSQMDIAIIKREPKKLIALVEIEETTNNPKKLIGDIFAVLMGDFIHLPGGTQVVMGDKTTLIILGKGEDHKIRNERLLKLADRAKSALGTVNSKIVKIVIESIGEKNNLEELLMKKVDEAIRKNA